MLIKDEYVNGLFIREELEGTFLYDRYYFEEIFIDKSKGNSLLKDYEAERELGEEELINYYNEINEKFEDFSKINHLTNEEVYGLIKEIRDNHFPETYFSKKIIKNKAYIKNAKIKDIGFEELLKELAYGEKTKRIESFGIDRSELLKERLANSKINVFLSTEAHQLAYLGELLKYTAKEAKSYILIKDEKILNEPILEELEWTIKNSKSLREGFENKRVEYLTYSNGGRGLDLNSISKEVEKALEKAELILGMGEDAVSSLHNSNVEYFLISKIERQLMQYYTNLFLNSKEEIHSVVAFIPKGYTVAKNFLGVERVEMTLYHFDRVYFSHSEEELEKNRDNILNLTPEYYTDFYSRSFEPKTYNFKIDSLKGAIENGDSLKNSLVEKSFNKRKIDYINSYYSYESFEKEDYKIHPHEDRDGVLVRGALINDSTKLIPQVKLAENYNTGIISVREILAKGEFKDDFYLYNNFLYFFTNNLIILYNELRNSRVHEKVGIKDFYLGYKSEKGKSDSFPLYNKGYIGFKDSGEVFFGRKKLEGGRLSLGNLEYSWKANDVNSSSSMVSLFTPNLLTDKEIEFDNHRKFSYEVGENRFNIVIIDNKIVCVRDGGVFLPSAGVVLSLDSKKLRDEFIGEFGLKEIEDGYYDISQLKDEIYLTLDKSEEEKGSSLAYGGGTLLIKNGENLVETKEKQEKSFREEGWFNPLSMQTQETQVQNWVRGPRSIMGKTKEGKLFTATFSGRHKETKGARFDEIVKILTKELGEISDMINLDGGASACAGVILDGEFFELNVPATSDFNCRGMVRPVNSMILMSL